MARTLVLGAGFGGIAVATGLRARLGDAHDVVLIDRGAHFSMGLRKLWELVGIGTVEEGRRARASLTGGGLTFVRAEITAIDVAARAATTDSGTFEADHLVVALGARSRPDIVPGLVEHGHDVWDVAGVPELRDAIAAFDGGRIVIVVTGAPYPCPPAPYECAMLLDDHLRRRGIRERTGITVATLQPLLMPNAGRDGSAWLEGQLDDRGIEYRTGAATERVEEGRVVLGDGSTLPFDLLIAVPPHRAPEVVTTAGLTGESGWIEVDRDTLRTGSNGVFAVGDCTTIRLANGLPLPKAGLIAEHEGIRVAEAIAAELEGTGEPPPFGGRFTCFVETGADSAALVDGRFFAEPEPVVTLSPPSRENHEAKRRFESDRLAAWFGS